MDLAVFLSVKALPKNKRCRTRPYGRQLRKENMSNLCMMYVGTTVFNSNNTLIIHAYMCLSLKTEWAGSL